MTEGEPLERESGDREPLDRESPERESPERELLDREPGPARHGRPYRLVAGFGWLVAAVLLALGSAGVVAATEHSPSSGARPELTWATDQALAGRLDGASGALVRLSADVDVLGRMARSVMANLTQLNQAGLQAAWNDGASAMSRVAGQSSALQAGLGCRVSDGIVNTDGMSREYGAPTIARFVQTCQAIDAVQPLQAAWDDVVFESGRALEVSQLISNHDAAGGQALELATKADYAGALTKLASASASISDAQAISNQLAKLTDVSTLQAWLERTADMDQALRLLWQAMLDSHGKITPQVTAALAAVSKAKALLPADTRVMSVVVDEMGQTLTADGLTIETAKGKLATAVGSLVSGTVVGQ